MKISNVKGTVDYLPQEVAIRDYLQSEILKVYTSNGFTRITTPIIEDIENLDKSEGGENLNLIFKILKRGDKLQKAFEGELTENNLADMGLRYDLTLPLTRYFANNRSKLPYPAKIIQMDRVYRAERPQKGRLREFMQCDVDIIGSDSIYSEIELINTVTEALLAITLKNFTVRVNNRRILNDLLLSMGFCEEDLMSVCITFDKMDKVGAEGVEKELSGKEFSADAVAKFVEFLKNNNFTLEYVKELMPESAAVSDVEKIIATANAVSDGKYDVVFDLSLVRGQGYYTGTVFEVVSNDFKGAIAGGGRYDNLIGKFLGESIPAVGFSIGFERIFAILSEQKFTPPTAKKKLAVIFEEANYAECVAKAKEMRKEFDVGMYERPKKLGKLLGRLENEGYYGALINPAEEIKVFEK